MNQNTTPSYIEDLFGLRGRTALVTGASSGIGCRAAHALARAGANVILVARRGDTLKSVADDIATQGGSAETIVADLSIRDEVTRVAADASALFNAPPGILINAAGVNPRQPAATVSWDTWETTLHLNLSVPFFLARELIEGMQTTGMGNIINVASMQSYRAFPDGAPYGASKGGIVQLTRAMAETWSQHGIVTNAIAPGFFPTQLTQAVFKNNDVAQHHADMTAIGRNGTLQDLDGAIIFLASRAAAYITGQVLPVDGGYTAK